MTAPLPGIVMKKIEQEEREGRTWKMLRLCLLTCGLAQPYFPGKDMKKRVKLQHPRQTGAARNCQRACFGITSNASNCVTCVALKLLSETSTRLL